MTVTKTVTAVIETHGGPIEVEMDCDGIITVREVGPHLAAYVTHIPLEQLEQALVIMRRERDSAVQYFPIGFNVTRRDTA